MLARPLVRLGVEPTDAVGVGAAVSYTIAHLRPEGRALLSLLLCHAAAAVREERVGCTRAVARIVPCCCLFVAVLWFDGLTCSVEGTVVAEPFARGRFFLSDSRIAAQTRRSESDATRLLGVTDAIWRS